jgi:hypothetical protein
MLAADRSLLEVNLKQSAIKLREKVSSNVDPENLIFILLSIFDSGVESIHRKLLCHGHPGCGLGWIYDYLLD